jgi:hypothetical protein
MMSMPEAIGCRTTAATALRTRVAKAAWSYDRPSSLAMSISSRSSGRGKLPACVVRIPSVRCFIAALLRFALR